MPIDIVDLKLASQEVLTRLHIVESVDALLATKPFDKLRVREICTMAGVSRQTFYNYFSNKADLAIWLEATIVEKHFSRIGRSSTWQRAIEDIILDLPSSASHLAWATVNSKQRREFLDKCSERIGEFLLYELTTVRGVALSGPLRFQCVTFPYVLVSLFDALVVGMILPQTTLENKVESILCYVPKELKEAMLRSGDS